IGTAGLPPKVAFAVVGDEKRSNGCVAIVGAEVTMPAVEPAELAVGTPRFQNGTTRRRIAQFLRQTKVFAFTDRAKFRTVFGEVFIQLRPAPKTGARGVEQQRQKEDADQSGHQ